MNLLKIKTFYKSFLGFILFFIFIKVSLANDLCSSPWKIGIYDNPPFQTSINEKESGLDIDIITEVAKKLDCEVLLIKIPWSRQFYEAKTGRLDIIMGAGKRNDREEYLYYLTPYKNLPSVVVFMNNSKSPKAFTLSNLKNMNITIGALIGAVFSEEYEHLIKDPLFSSKIELSSKTELIINKLRLGRIDGAFFTGILEVKKLMPKEYNNNELIIYPISSIDYGYFAYSKKTFDLLKAKKIDKVIQDLNSDGTLKKLMKKYFNQNEIKSISVAN
ncbi:transporter substrate-binding domain-containing protein [Pigmentibacter sp. JX0631]|uniref:substrate-binding periplasmic protein n=1 Tax=Pigmentibacter sp. JX0631 TaxID=2976982 RepID=UPI002469AF29|nr:transporter substrate-binding domain-containing protein [Pigmentibacter sp. JX0631]WGL60508.1 transporter substrate-binding domain-containing protein [Pigmentibacter sp. JX0631]